MAAPETRLRLDELLVASGHFATRSRARDAILRGAVTVDGRAATKPGQPVDAGADLAIDDLAQAYVSRAALKLIAGLDHFKFDPTGANALDIGASTGGFTEVLLQRGAAHVAAIDVGSGQMHERLRAEPRVTLVEGLNARDLDEGRLGSLPDFIVCDVSFISLKLALPPALRLAAPGARGVFLVKPQFEAGRDAIGKGGILRDPALGERIAGDLSAWLDGFDGWRSLGFRASPVDGGDGNREYLMGGVKDR